ncbi:hypothetical protein C8Q74DRAFT_1257734 [Fomes fomentarius]|nr:hypothetical protein C8Q74DRAFT_1257734 [Fomes fomentarius]
MPAFMGQLADLVGRKYTFILGCVFMGVFGLVSGFAQNEITIDILRALQGLGPAASIPAGLGISAHALSSSPIRSIAFARAPRSVRKCSRRYAHTAHSV